MIQIFLNRRAVVAITAASGIVASGCSAPRSVRQDRSEKNTRAAVSMNQPPAPPLQHTPTRAWDILHTAVTLTPNIPQRAAAGTARIVASPIAYVQDSMVLDAKGMELAAVTEYTGHGNGTPLHYAYNGKQLVIHLPRSIAAGDQVVINVGYTARPYGSPTGGNDAIEEDRGLYFINAMGAMPGKPLQLWTQGETESNSHWFPTFDKPVERFTLDLSLRVPDSLVTVATGSLIQTIPARTTEPYRGLRTDVWRIDKTIQPYAVAFAIGRFAKVTDTSWSGKEVSYYVEPQYASLAKRIFPNTRPMLTYFSRVTCVPYPWNKYSQVVVRDFVSGAMENTTASIFGEFILGTARELDDQDGEDVVAHELFHQWFGDYATAESWTHINLNESFANYGEVLWRRHNYGDASADEHAQQALRSYLSSTTAGDPPLVRTRYNDPGDVFDRVSYQKGGSILHYLHGLLGDSVFSRAMNIYLTRNAFQPAETGHWRQAVEEASGEDWNWFFDQWYHRGGHPRVRISYRYDDAARTVTATVIQRGSDTAYRLPVKTALIYADGRADTVRWDIRNARQTFAYPYGSSGKRPLILPDVHHWIVGAVEDNKGPHEGLWRYQLITSADYRK